LRLAEGKRNLAEFKLTLRYNGSDIKGGTTEDGDIVGYSGGSAASNASVNFKATPAAPVAAQGGSLIAAVKILFGGYNTPPRLSLKEDDRPEKRENLQQRFSGSLKFDASGRLFGKPDVRVNPVGTCVAPGSYGDGSDRSPVVSVSLNTTPSKSAAPKPTEDVQIGVTPATPAPPGSI
jgi:hypothetical protein